MSLFPERSRNGSQNGFRTRCILKVYEFLGFECVPGTFREQIHVSVSIRFGIESETKRIETVSYFGKAQNQRFNGLNAVILCFEITEKESSTVTPYTVRFIGNRAVVKGTEIGST